MAKSSHDGLVPSDEQRDNHLRIYDHVAQGKNRQPLDARMFQTGGVVQVKLPESGGFPPCVPILGFMTTNTQV